MTNGKSTCYILFASLVMLVSNRDADACQCFPGSVEHQFSNAAAVFSGTVQAISAYDGERTEHRVDFVVTFEVDKAWKGAPKTPLILHVARPIGDCDGFTFGVGQEYLVYAYNYTVSLPSTAEKPQRTERRLGVDTCSRTSKLSEAAEDLRILGAPGQHQQEVAQ